MFLTLHGNLVVSAWETHFGIHTVKKHVRFWTSRWKWTSTCWFFLRHFRCPKWHGSFPTFPTSNSSVRMVRMVREAKVGPPVGPPVARCKVVSFSLKLTFSPLKNDGFPLPEFSFSTPGVDFQVRTVSFKEGKKFLVQNPLKWAEFKVNTSWRLRRSRRQKRKRKNHLIVCWPTGWWRNTPPQKKHLLNIKMDLYIYGKKGVSFWTSLELIKFTPSHFRILFWLISVGSWNNHRSIIFLWISVQLVTFLPIERSRNQRRPTGWVGLGTCGCSLFEKSRLQYQGNSRPRLWW